MATTSFKGLTASTETFDGSPFRVAIVHARWNMPVIEPLVKGCYEELVKSGVKEDNIVIESVPASQSQAPSSAALGTDLLGVSSLLDPLVAGNEAPVSSSSGATSGLGSRKAGTGLKGPFSAVVAIGTLIKGSTMHFEYICGAVSDALMRIGLDTGVPVIFGVLTCLTEEQALERAGVDGKGHNHGIDWGKAAVEGAVKASRWKEGKF